MVLFADDTITLFNKHLDTLTEEETWIPTLLVNCNYVSTKGVNISKSGIKDADTAKFYCDADSFPEDKDFLEPMEWNAQTLDKKKESFTFQPETDFFVKGDLTEVEPMEEGFFEWMINHYDHVHKITTVDEFDKVFWHLEIGGK